MKKLFIVGLFFLIICLGLVIYGEVNDKYSINIHEITNSASKKENVKVYLNASFIGGSIKYNDINYYVIFADGVQYLVLISDKKASEIKKYLLDNPMSTYKIIGITKSLPDGIEEIGIKFIKNWLDSNHNHNAEDEHNHEHNITNDDFYTYFGYVYLDTNVSDYRVIITIIVGIIGTLLTISYLIKKYQIL